MFRNRSLFKTCYNSPALRVPDLRSDFLENTLHLRNDGMGMLNLLNPTGSVMHQQFNIQQLYVLPTLYLCVLYLSENKQRLVSLQHKLIGFYNRDEKCLLRGTNWVFKSTHFVYSFTVTVTSTSNYSYNRQPELVIAEQHGHMSLHFP